MIGRHPHPMTHGGLREEVRVLGSVYSMYKHRSGAGEVFSGAIKIET